ncbi:MAG: DUF192 domain-containing protein [Desulfobacca sp.]|nr:DUF192 domain-containing protein [Desulfobacca sp.]
MRLKFKWGLSLFLVLMLAFPSDSALSAATNQLRQICINGVELQVEVVDSPAQIFQGLSGRNALPPGQGMLFMMPTLEQQHFCMRGMRFGLDIIWIARGRIIGMAKNLDPQDNRTFSSPAPADQVLEVPAGFCDQHQLKINNMVSFK